MPEDTPYAIVTTGPRGNSSNPLFLEYLCRSGDGFEYRLLACRNCFWERDGTYVRSEWRRLTGKGHIAINQNRYKILEWVSEARAIGLLLSAGKIRKSP